MTRVEARAAIAAARQRTPWHGPPKADTRMLDDVAWALCVLIFAVLPFAVVLFRTDMIAWHDYAAGAHEPRRPRNCLGGRPARTTGP